MLIRFVAKNIYSFKHQTEFNLLPNKTQRLPHHKVSNKGIDSLRLSAIYGANGSGKSNLIKAITLLKSMVVSGSLIDNVSDIKFRLSEENTITPISLAIEFFSNSKNYYYTLTFDKDIILNESLVESKKESDVLIFERNNQNDTQSIIFYEDYVKNSEKNKLFVEVLAEKLILKNELLLSFLNSKYKAEFNDISTVFNWFSETLIIIKPNSIPAGIAHYLDTNDGLKDFANDLLPTLNTGIIKLSIDKKAMEHFSNSEEQDKLRTLAEDLKKAPNQLSSVRNKKTGEEMTMVYENDEICIKTVLATHLNDRGIDENFPIAMESDGTKRLIDYIPALNGIINHESVYLIDEIERSIHPLTIKNIISKISLDSKAKGQLIFTTHESSLLDQDILRTDEIWFAQKDIDGSSRLYSLSDFNIHNTANIENGYLNGRYGGIPFLSNLQDLNWHKYEVSE
ncbi:MAG: ATP-binding protein [Cytophagaceae bacterium]|nr:ATP-binding protein [Cytophagaceae bacterium]